MSGQNWDWVDKREAEIAEGKGKEYFNIEEGDNKFVLLSHFAPLAQVFDPSTKKYHIAEEGEQGASIKGVCWVYQDGEIKSAKMPYTLVKFVRGLSEEPDWDFSLPFLNPINLKAKGAGKKEVEYTITVSPKKIDLDQAVLVALSEKPTPEEMVEKMKANAKGGSDTPASGPVDYPESDIKPEDIPF